MKRNSGTCLHLNSVVINPSKKYYKTVKDKDPTSTRSHTLKRFSVFIKIIIDSIISVAKGDILK